MAVIFENNTLGVVTSGGNDAPSSGSTETWTVATSGYVFPTTVATGNWFHVADPQLQSEKIKVTAVTGTGPYTWTTVRGDEGTSTVAHGANFSVQQVVTAADFTQMDARASLFYIDDYGSDPTGTNASDTAWNSAYSAATATLASGGTHHGAIVVFGAGTYKFSINVLQITDYRIGMIGQGKTATIIETSGNTGDLLFTNQSGNEPGGASAPPIGGFTLYGWSSGNATKGFHITGERPYSLIYDVDVQGFNANATSYGWYVAPDNAGGLEGTSVINCSSQVNNTNYAFDGGQASPGGTLDYTFWDLHTINGFTAFTFFGNIHSNGAFWNIHGNLGNADFPGTVVCFNMGTASTDASKMQGGTLNLAVEADSGSTLVQDFNIKGTGGVVHEQGIINFLNASGSWTAGTITTANGAGFIYQGTIRNAPAVSALTSTAFAQLGGDTSAVDTSLAGGRLDNMGAIQYTADTVQTIAASGTIKTSTDGMFGVVPVTAASNVGSVILQKPSRNWCQITVINHSSNTITFAASATSFVADGTSNVLGALTARTFTFDGGTSLWYRST